MLLLTRFSFVETQHLSSPSVIIFILFIFQPLKENTNYFTAHIFNSHITFSKFFCFNATGTHHYCIIRAAVHHFNFSSMPISSVQKERRYTHAVRAYSNQSDHRSIARIARHYHCNSTSFLRQEKQLAHAITSQFVLGRSSDVVTERLDQARLERLMTEHLCGFHDWGVRRRTRIQSYFLSRYPVIAVMNQYGNHLTKVISRMSGIQWNRLKTFFSIYKSDIERLNIPQRNTWNMDERRIYLAVQPDGHVHGGSNRHEEQACSLSCHAQEPVTVLETVSVTGRLIQTLMISRGRSLPWNTYSNREEAWACETTCRGDSTCEVMLSWLRHTFIPQTRPQGYCPRLLFLNGHGNSVSIDFM